VHYYGNADPVEELVYVLNSLEVKKGIVSTHCLLYRTSDKKLIAQVFTEKRLNKVIVFRKKNASLSSHTSLKSSGAAKQAGKESVDTIALPGIGLKGNGIKEKKPGTLNPALRIDKKTLNFSITGFFKTALHKSRINATTNLMAYGIESIIYLELSDFLLKQHQIQSNPSRFYGLVNVDQISDYLLNETHSHNNTIDNEEAIPASQNNNDIAIIAYSFRFPGGSTKKDFWQVLENGLNAVTKVNERWNWPENINATGNNKGIYHGGYLNNIKRFDPDFFHISPREAMCMDPQQRFLMELSWELFESAGYKVSDFRNTKTGVFIGASGSDYEQVLNENGKNDVFRNTGTAMSLLANRISHFYDFSGPSIQIDTACSSSLVAIHEAVKAIRSGECQQAVVGGIHLMCHPSKTISYNQSGMLSPDGECFTFDERANGYVRGEGAGLLLIKPLEQAIKDNDKIAGIIKAGSVNHGGLSSGLTVPNPVKQRELIESAYGSAGIDIETVSYIEAHGTGTSLGDPIEINGLAVH
jgi:3-oxoacyl-(acyl-carrier-protein) synthase